MMIEHVDLSSTASFIASLVCIALGTFAWFRYSGQGRAALDNKEKKSSYPPCPKERHWLFKHGAALAGDGVSSHDITFLGWMKKLQSKVVLFEIPFLGRFIVVGDAQVAKHVLQSRAKNGGVAFPKSPTYKSMIPLLGRKSILVVEGQEWSHQRRLFQPGFAPDYLRGTVTTMARKISRFLEILDAEDVARNQPTNMLARAVDLTADVIAQVAFGEDWGCPSSEDRHGGNESRAKMRDVIQLVQDDFRNPLNGLINPFYKWRVWRLSTSLDRDMARLVERRIASLRQSTNDGTKAPQNDILSLTLSGVLKANEEDRKKQAKDHIVPEAASFSNEDMECVTSQLKSFYFAGHDTTATTIAWAYWLLVKNLQVLQTAREEVEEHLGRAWVDAVSGTNQPHIEIPEESTTYENLQKCQYLDAIARETLRLYPPAASTRYPSDPRASYGGYKLGGSIVHLNFYAIQRDPDYWGPDANEFRPERFLGEAGRANLRSQHFLPFSRGSRDCIGKYFALLEAKIALAALIVRYDGTVVDDDEVYAARLTSIPGNGCQVKLSRR
jgi:cytochrome P450